MRVFVMAVGLVIGVYTIWGCFYMPTTPVSARVVESGTVWLLTTSGKAPLGAYKGPTAQVAGENSWVSPDGTRCHTRSPVLFQSNKAP